MQKMKKVSLYADPAVWKKLGAISKETMIPVAALIRKALDDIVKQYSKK